MWAWIFIVAGLLLYGIPELSYVSEPSTLQHLDRELLLNKGLGRAYTEVQIIKELSLPQWIGIISGSVGIGEKLIKLTRWLWRKVLCKSLGGSNGG